MNVSKLGAIAAMAGGLAMAGTAPLHAANPPESDDPIKVIKNNWTSQLVQAHVIGQLFERMGYSVEYKPADMQAQFTAMSLGDLHVQTEVWEGTAKTAFMKEVEQGEIIDVGSHDASTREDWWYPSYVEDICPGLPDWTAINDCAEKLATPSTYPKARYLGGPADWEKHDEERVEALSIKAEVVHAGSSAALWSELKSAYQRKEPIIMFNWSPNWVHAEYDGKYIKFPDWHPKCQTDAGWGQNPDKRYDCGNPKGAWLKKGVWAGMKDKWPCAFKTVQNYNLTNPQIAEMAALVVTEDIEPDAAAKRWLADNQDLADNWIPKSCQG
jgi:glycine betaine/proline transport system substrate-binding protein